MTDNPGGYIDTLYNIMLLLGYNIKPIFQYSIMKLLLNEDIYKNKSNEMTE